MVSKAGKRFRVGMGRILATAPQAESSARGMLDSGQLTRDQGSPELQKQVPPVSVEHSAALVAGATGQTDK